MWGAPRASDRNVVRRAAEAHGRRSEFWAALLLSCKFYRVLGRRVKTRLGELDLIALSPDGILCFIEVKARARSKAPPPKPSPPGSDRASPGPRRFTWVRIPRYATKLSDSMRYW